jgi:hypothetical protein
MFKNLIKFDSAASLPTGVSINGGSACCLLRAVPRVLDLGRQLCWNPQSRGLMQNSHLEKEAAPTAI